MDMEKLRADLAPLQEHDVVLFGSILTDRFSVRSDVDVAVVTRDSDHEAAKQTWWNLLGKVPPSYDVKVFELLPLPVQMDIVEHHQVVFGEEVDLSEYFYVYRRRWKDQRHRIEANRFHSFEEKMDALRRARAART